MIGALKFTSWHFTDVRRKMYLIGFAYSPICGVRLYATSWTETSVRVKII